MTKTIWRKTGDGPLTAPSGYQQGSRSIFCHPNLFYRHVYQELYSILNSCSLDALKAGLDARRAAYFTGTFWHGLKYPRNLQG